MKKSFRDLAQNKVRATFRGEIKLKGAVMKVKELADYLRVHPATIYSLLRRGELPGFRIASEWRFNVESIDLWRLEREQVGILAERKLVKARRTRKMERHTGPPLRSGREGDEQIKC